MIDEIKNFIWVGHMAPMGGGEQFRSANVILFEDAEWMRQLGRPDC
jgi:hypothetical protein